MKKAYRTTGGFILLLLLLSAACREIPVSDIESYRLGFLPAMRAVESEIRELFPPEEGFQCKCRLKKAESMREKVGRKGLAGLEDLTDVAGCRVVIPDLESLPTVERTVRGNFRVVERESHLENMRGTGYRAVHYLVEKNGKIVEIQVQTLRQSIWRRLSHRWVYKGPYPENEGVKRYLRNLSRAIYALDRGKEATLPEPPVGLPGDFRTAAGDSLRRLRAVGNEKPLSRKPSSVRRKASFLPFSICDPSHGVGASSIAYPLKPAPVEAPRNPLWNGRPGAAMIAGTPWEEIVR